MQTIFSCLSKSCRRTTVVLTAAALMAGWAAPTYAQTPDTSAAPPVQAGEGTVAETQEILSSYRLNSLDRLYVVVYSGDKLIEEVREYIKSDGTIYMPFIEQDVKLAGLSLIEAEGLVSSLSRTYIRNPRIVITVLSSFSQTVSTYGKIQNITIDLNLPMRILQAIAKAGGPEDDAKADSIRVISTDGTIRYFDYPRVNANPTEVRNFYLNPGDIIFVPGTNDLSVMVLGNVQRPGKFPMKTGSRILDAVIMAGSWGQTADIENVRLIRIERTGRVLVYEINMKDIFDKGNLRLNYSLGDGDILFIPTSSTSRIIQLTTSVLTIIHTLLTSYVVYVTIKND